MNNHDVIDSPRGEAESRSRSRCPAGYPTRSIWTGAVCLLASLGLLGGLVAAPPASAADPIQVSTISAGSHHTCAIRISGQAVCWGGNEYGQLGNGTGKYSPTPTNVSGLTDAVAISAGEGHTCAIRASGQAVCWGAGGNGRLGNGAETNSPIPVNVSGLTDAVSISAGYGSCAVRTSGQAVCWGANEVGEIGDGTTTDRLTPTDVSGLTDAVAISASPSGYDPPHTCAIRQSGQAVCWGDNYLGEIGDGTETNRLTPTNVSGLTDATQISAGEDHTCAVRTSGQAVCWGSGGNGELGNGSWENRLTPTDVTGLADAVAISAGAAHNCAIRTSGQAVCWGYGEEGQLGDGTTPPGDSTPVNVTGLTDAAMISAGGYHTCAIRTSGQAECWGNNWANFEFCGGECESGWGFEESHLTPVTVLEGPGPSVKLWLDLTGEGLGEVTASPAADPCVKVPGLPGVICQFDFTPGTHLVLTASAASGSSFAGWGGDCAGAGPVCEVTIAGEDHISGEFGLLTTQPSSNGGGGGSSGGPGGGATASTPSASAAGGSTSGGQKPNAARCISRAEASYKKATKAASHKKGKARAKALKAAKKLKAKRVSACGK